MGVPDFQSLMLPLLAALGDGATRRLADLHDTLTERLNVSPHDVKELLPSGRQTRFRNRVAWAKVYLEQAGLVESPQRGLCRITDRGRAVLTQTPERIDIAFLSQFPDFVSYRSGRGRAPESVGPVSTGEARTPEEALEATHQALREELAAELLDRVKKSPPSFFERLVVELLLRMGYGGSKKDAGEAIGGSGDGGVDGIIKEDRLGLDTIYVQAKRWDGTVGRPVVQAFAGSLEGQRARKGILITTSQFSSDARDYVERIEKKIVLIDGRLLANLMIEHGLGVATVATYEIKKIDSDYFAED